MNKQWARTIQHGGNIAQLADLLLKSWSQETSCDPNGWSDENPAHGQSAVTALLVQDELGGDIIRVHYNDGEGKGEHYSIVCLPANVPILRGNNSRLM